LNGDGIRAEWIEDFDAVADRVAGEAQPGDVVIVMSSGAFDGVHEKILEKLRRPRVV
jgi:UDP-N-acetylmuramate: L-alanyl-gamma-D-glutamyl-meso-diaminopimelate ligase